MKFRYSVFVALGFIFPTGASSQSFETGAYFGLHAGFGIHDKSSRLSGSPIVSLLQNQHPVLQDPSVPKSLDAEPDGFLGGLQAGYSVRASRWVVGLEGDLSGGAIDGEASDVRLFLGLVPFKTELDQETNWLATLRPRLGYLVTDGLLVYATAGLAVGEVETQLRFGIPEPGFAAGIGFNGSVLACQGGESCLSGSDKEVEAGWVVGGGVELMLTTNLSLKAEYEYIDLGKVSVKARPTAEGLAVGTTPDNFIKGSTDVEIHAIKVGLNHRF